MSTQTIDYSALAKQAGAISSAPAGGMDYSALAKQAGAISSVPAQQQEDTGFLDKSIPLDSYSNATLSGVQSIGRGARDAATGLWNVIAHPIDTVKGIAAIPGQVAQVPAAVRDINQSADPVGTYAKVGQDTAGQGAAQALIAAGTMGAAKAVGAASNAIPSASRAGQAFQDIKSAAGSVPINTAKVGDSALELYTQAQRGASLPLAVRKLVVRLTTPDAEPLTYSEAKDFQSNISSLSANEKMSLKPNQVRLVGKLNADLKASLEDAADTVGKGQQFADAMKEYHNAMKIRGYSDAAIDAAWKAALGSAGVYGAAKIFGLAKAP